MQIEALNQQIPACQLGEGAYYDRQSDSFYWVDIEGCTVNRYDFARRKHRSWKVSRKVTFAFRQGANLIVCLENGVYEFDPKTGAETPIAVVDLPSEHRLNDAKLDPRGRLWIGSINTSSDPSETAALYRLHDRTLEEVESGYVNANGKAWSLDGKLMYHADTSRGIIWEYEYDVETGCASHKRVFVKIPDGNPDGICTDDAGNIVAAMYGDACVKVFSVRGELIKSIDLPAPNPTSCALNGSKLLVTTAFDGMSEEARQKSPLSGQVLIVPYDVPR